MRLTSFVYPLKDGQKGDSALAEVPARIDSSPEYGIGCLGEVHQVRRTAHSSAQKWTSVRGGFARIPRAQKALVIACFTASLFAAEPSTKARTISYIETDEIPRIYVQANSARNLQVNQASPIQESF